MSETLWIPAMVPPDPPIRIRSCPFDGGPGVLKCQEPPPDELTTEYGRLVEAYVWCHECGVKGPVVDARIDATAEKWGVMTRAVELWNQRDSEDRAEDPEGRDLFPRADGRDTPR